MIKSISIHGLRGFGEKREINFAIPKGVEGSGITFTISTMDIRDKREIKNRPGKVGMMTVGGKLKAEYIDEMKNLLQNINACFG